MSVRAEVKGGSRIGGGSADLVVSQRTAENLHAFVADAVVVQIETRQRLQSQRF